MRPSSRPVHQAHPARHVRLRSVLTGAMLVGTVGLALLASGATIVARPPSMPTPVPSSAFHPFVVPRETAHPDRRSRLAPDESRDLAASAPPAANPSPAADPAADPGAPDANPQSSMAPAARIVPAQPPRGPTHVVRPGDTLWDIAAWHRVDVALIARWNPGVEPRRLVDGQRLLIPGGAPMPKTAGRAARSAASRSNPTPRTQAGGVIRMPSGAEHLWPLGLRGTITTRFSTAHPGIDIAAPRGTPVRAIAAGTVTWAGWKMNGGGYVVVIRHPDGMISTYNHNRGVAVRAGESVSAGETIAWVGSSGRATGPHLDLRIEMDGRLVDPLAVY